MNPEKIEQNFIEELKQAALQWWGNNREKYEATIQEMKDERPLIGNLEFPIHIKDGVIDKLFFNNSLGCFEYISLSIGEGDSIQVEQFDGSVGAGYADRVRVEKLYLNET